MARPDLHVAASLRDGPRLLTSSKKLMTDGSGRMGWAFGDPPNLVKFPPPQFWVKYDPVGDPDPRKQDAAKIEIPVGSGSSKQVHIRELNIVGPGPALLTWDAWWGAEFQTDRGTLETHKEFQIAPNDPEDRGFEIRSRFVLATAPDIATIDGRVYTALGPGTIDNQPLDPQIGAFTIAPETWTRYWALVELGTPWTHLSLWVADEHRDAVQLFDRLAVDWMTADGPQSALAIENFRFEYNTSQSRDGSGSLIGYLRNFVALTTSDVAPLLVRPVG